MNKIITITNNKGGCLKTSITTNIASLLSKEHKILIIDMDNQGNVSLSFGKNPDRYEHTVYDVMLKNTDPYKAIEEVHENIFLLPANDNMSFLEFDVLRNPKRFKNPFELLKNKIEGITSDFDYILIDTPPNISLAQGNALTLSSDVIIPFQPESYSMRSLIKMLFAINSFKNDHNEDLNILGIIGTLVDNRTRLHKEVMNEARSYCESKGIHMFETYITKSIMHANSIAYNGLPATLTESNRNIKEYTNLIGEITNELE